MHQIIKDFVDEEKAEKATAGRGKGKGKAARR